MTWDKPLLLAPPGSMTSNHPEGISIHIIDQTVAVLDDLMGYQAQGA
ncbi:MAG: hypothetical protein ACR2PT_05195 [Endozoicomonas sp.]